LANPIIHLADYRVGYLDFNAKLIYGLLITNLLDIAYLIESFTKATFCIFFCREQLRK